MLPLTPMKALIALAIVFFLYQANFWFDSNPIQDLSLPQEPLIRISENAASAGAHYPYPDKKRNEGSSLPSQATFESLGHIGEAMPKDAKLRWTNKEGNATSCWLEKGQILICPPLTQDLDVKLMVLEVREVERDGGYDYELWLKEVDSGKKHRLPLNRLNHQVRLFP